MGPLVGVFVGQFVLAATALWLGRRAGRSPRAGGVAIGVGLALMAACVLMRVFPAWAIALAGARVVACTEFTVLMIPTALVFGAASRRMPNARDRRTILVLAIVAAAYFARAGWWMVAPGIDGLPPMAIDRDGVCRQSTGATCVASSMVTALRAHGVAADEEEMARLAYTDSGGTTDSRALWALERKLEGTELRPRYTRLDLAGLGAAPKPALVQLDWGFFVSHMVPVLEVTGEGVVIGDPLEGRRTMSEAEFRREWKGMAIVIEPAR